MFREHDGVVRFDADLALGALGFPENARIVVEAFFKGSFMRFDFGTIAHPTAPLDRRVVRLAQPSLARYRVKVVAPVDSGLGLLLGVADHIAPEGVRLGEQRRVSLFRVNLKSALGHEIWRLDIDPDDGDGPILELNADVLGIKEIARRELYFKALVYPEILRRIWYYIFTQGGLESDEDLQSWQMRWMRFGTKLVGEEPPKVINDEPGLEHDDWIDRAVAGWSRQQKIVSEFKANYAIVSNMEDSY